MTNSNVRFAFVFIAILAVFLRATIPAGFMPEFNHGKIAITICHGAGTKTVFMDTNNQSNKTAPTQTECAFAPIAQNDKGLGDPIIIALGPVNYTYIVYALSRDDGHLDHTHHLGQPRAPPISL